MPHTETHRSGIEGIRDLASRLAEGRIVKAEAIHGGRNNAIFRVTRDDGEKFAFKRYVTPRGDGRERLDAEYRGLSFLADCGTPAVPHPIAADRRHGVALYEWIIGGPIERPTVGDVEAAADFVLELRKYSAFARARTMPKAREACLSAADVISQVHARVLRLADAAKGYPELADFVHREFVAEFTAHALDTRGGFEKLGIDSRLELEPERQILSPSDFGFHNALRGPDGGVVFVDFEYFGWDDPVKLIADFVLHPGMNLSPEMKRRFLRRLLPAFVARDETFLARMNLLFPLFGLRWCMIVLNEFLPERWARRAFAGAIDRTAEQSRQLAKARRMLRDLKNESLEFPLDG